MEAIQAATNYFFLFMLVFLRLSGLMMFAPFFGSQNIPAPVKIGIILMLSLAVTPMLVGMSVTFTPPRYLSEFALFALRELAVGLTIGLVATMIFAAIQLAGHHIGQTMGFAIANVIDPMSEAQVTILGQLYFFFGVTIFLLVDGHLAMVGLMVKSFQVVDLGTMGNTAVLTEHISNLFTYMFDLSLRLAAPLLVMLLLLTVALGFMARTVPQMNIMVVGFPLQIAVGFVFLILLMPFLAEIFTVLWSGFVGQLETVIRIMRTTP